MSYVDSFVVPVPIDRMEDYLRIARQAGEIWKEHGALDYVECVANDVKEGKHTSFPQSVQLQPGETVVFSWIRYSSREERDRMGFAAGKGDGLTSLVPPSCALPAHDRFLGALEPTHQVVEEQAVGNGQRDGNHQRGGHQFRPVEDIAADQLGRYAGGDGALR